MDEDFEEALGAFSQAIDLAGPASKETAEYYVKRSACHAKLQHHTDAVADANAALAIDPQNPRALLRKGTACFALDEFEAAREAFQAGLAVEPANSTFKTWLRKCEAELAGEEGREAEASSGEAAAPAPAQPATTAPAPAQEAPKEAAAPAPAPTQAAEAAAPPKEPRVRHTWYQNESFVYVTFYQRDLKQTDVKVQFEEKELDVTLELPDGTSFVFDAELCDAIVPDQCKIAINRANVEIKLKKARSGQWANLEAKPGAVVNPWPDTSSANKHLYPSSSRKKLNWDQLEKEVEEEKLEGDAALNKVFQDIFAGGSEEQRRAMIKSFTESGGTVLSTNWDEVGKAPVKGSPPKGMEAKSYKE